VVAANLHMQDDIMSGHDRTTIMDESLLEALLGHPAINQNSAVLASLMSSSSQLQLAAHQHCVGQVHAKCSAKSRNYLLNFTRWLARSGHLAKSLFFSGGGAWTRTVKDPIWEAALAGALQRAALASPHGLQLQSFSGWASSSVVLRALPASHLTHLALASMNAVPNSSVADVVAGIAGLTALQKLILTGSDSNGNSPRPGAVEAYLPALPALTNLTFLALSGNLDWQLLQLPAMPQLRHLRLSLKPALWGVRREQALQLGHLSAVSELHLSSIAVQERDELPPQLQKLCSCDVLSVEPLCSLRQLQSLEIDTASTPAAQLQQLAQSVRSLCSVELHYGAAEDVPNSAAGWLALPLQALRIDVRDRNVNRVQHSTLPCIARLRGITALDLFGCEFPHTAEWQLAEVIAQLTGLQSLGILDLYFSVEDEEEEAAAEAGQQQQAGDAAGAVGPVVPAAAQQAAAGVPAAADAGPDHAAAAPPAAPDLLGWPAVLRAAAHLPQLRSLNCDAPNAAAVAQLVAATQLQGLSLINTARENWQQDSPSEPVLVDLLCCLTGLSSVSLDHQPHLSDTAMPVIGRFLTQLTRLSIDNSRITDVGLTYLTGLRRLSDLSVMATAVTPAAAQAVLPDVRVSVEPVS
jgi:hypothetical protein